MIYILVAKHQTRYIDSKETHSTSHIYIHNKSESYNLILNDLLPFNGPYTEEQAPRRLSKA